MIPLIKVAAHMEVIEPRVPNGFRSVQQILMDKFGNFLSIFKAAADLADALGGSGKGQIDRGDGKIVQWSFESKIHAFQLKFRGECVDETTGETGSATQESRGGAIEHSMKDLFQKLASMNAL